MSVLLSRCKASKLKFLIQERQTVCASVAIHCTFQSFVCLHGKLHSAAAGFQAQRPATDGSTVDPTRTNKI
jgi:hypothetical protein